MVTWIPSIYPSHVSIYTIHGSYGYGCGSKLDTKRFDPGPNSSQFCALEECYPNCWYSTKNIKSLSRSRRFPLWYSNMAMEVHRLCTLRMIFQLRPTWASSGLPRQPCLITYRSWVPRTAWQSNASGVRGQRASPECNNRTQKRGCCYFSATFPLWSTHVHAGSLHDIAWIESEKIGISMYQWFSLVDSVEIL